MKIRRAVKGVYLIRKDGTKSFYDKVVLTMHAPDALEILEDATQNEVEILSAFKYKENSAVLHKDNNILYPNKKMYAAWNYTSYEKQKKLCEDRFKEHSVEDKIDILLKDYRDLNGSFDAIIAVEMFEVVGPEYFHIFFKKCQEFLKPNGVLVLQVITMPDQRYKDYSKGTDFIQKYIFPGGHLPSISKILETTTKHTRLNLNHLEEFTED